MIKNSLAVLFPILTACSSLPANEPMRFEPKQFESIQTGDSAKTATGKLGTPSEIRSAHDNDDVDELWIYDDGNGSQRGALSVDRSSQLVTAVTVLPRASDPERQLEFLLKNKFASASFEKAPLRRCERDFVPLQLFYISIEKGFLIETNRQTNEVQSYSRVTPSQAAELFQQIKECKR